MAVSPTISALPTHGPAKRHRWDVTMSLHTPAHVEHDEEPCQEDEVEVIDPRPYLPPETSDDRDDLLDERLAMARARRMVKQWKEQEA